MQIAALLVSRHGSERVKLVTSEEIIYAPYWDHRVETGHVVSELRLTDGTTLSSADIQVVFNRLCYAPVSHFQNEDDRAYAIMEFYALLLSWLHSLSCPVINPAVPQGLGAHQYSQFTWFAWAAQAGLPVRDLQYTTNPRYFPAPQLEPHRRTQQMDSNREWLMEPIPNSLVSIQPTFFLESPVTAQQQLLVAGETIVGPLSARYRAALLRLAKLAHCDLLQVEFGQFGRDWKVLSVNAFPQLTTQDEFLVLLTLLENKYQYSGLNQ